MAVQRKTSLSTQEDQLDPNWTDVPDPTFTPTPPGAGAYVPPAPPSYIPGIPNTDFGGGNAAQQNRQIGDTFGAPAPAGWDATKWADQSHMSDKYKIGHILAGSGGIDDAITAMGPGWKKVSNDVIQDPTGHQVDLFFDYGGPNQHLQWYDVPGTGGAPAAPGASGPSGAALPAGGGLDLSALSKLFGGGGGQLTAQAIEAARMPYEIARKSQLANAQADLANRGLLSEPGHLQGPEVSAIQHIEEGLAPAYTGAINDRLLRNDQTDVQRQQVIGQIALGNLEQNRLWQQFLAQYGLDRDKVAYDMQHGNTDQYLQLLQLFLQHNKNTNDGYV